MFRRLLGFILLVYFILAGGYAVVTPIFEKPDENWHFAVAMHLLETGQLPQNTINPPNHLSRHQAHQPPLYYLTLAPLLRVLGFQNLTTGYLTLAQPNEQYRFDTPYLTSDNRRVFIQGRCENECISTRNAVYIGRALSIVYVGLGLLFAGMAINIVFPNNHAIVLLTTALIGFNPQVLHIASSVSNDSLTILLMNLGFFLMAQWLIGKRDYKIVIMMGLVAGAVLITKLSAGSLGLVMGCLLLMTSSSRVRHISVFAIVSLSISAWWFIYNGILYGDPTALALHISLAPQQAAPETAFGIIAQLPTVVRSFWMEFGWGQIVLPSYLYDMLYVFIGISFSSCLVFVSRSWEKLSQVQQRFLMLALFIVIVVFILLLRWMSMTQAPHGRLLFPAILPISLFMAMGLLALIKPKRQLIAIYGIVFMLGISASIIPIQFIYPVYLAPQAIIEPQSQSPQITFHENDGGDLYLTDIAIVLDETLLVQITWIIENPLENDYLVFVHALNAEGQIIAQRDSYPGLSNMPFTRLKENQVFYDVYALMRPDEAIESLRIGIYRVGTVPNTWERLDAESPYFAIEDNAVLIPSSAVRFSALD